jgi:hypothetical protein
MCFKGPFGFGVQSLWLMVVEPIASQLRACFFGVVARIRRVSASPTGSCVGGEGGSDGAALGGLNWVYQSEVARLENH